MDISWFHLLSANVEAFLTLTQTSPLQTSQQPSELLKSLLSVNVQREVSLSNIVIVAYLLVSVLIKRSSFLVAFFVSWMLFELSVFSTLSEASLYLLTFSIYSYVIFCNGLTLKTRLACGILLILSITLAYDAYFYGIDGVYGASETFVYNNIQHLALYAHIVLISTLVPYRRISDGFRRFIDSISHLARNSAYIVIC